MAAKTQSFESFGIAVCAVDRQSDDCNIDVQMQMKKVFDYENRTDAEVQIESKITKGILTREKDFKKEKSENSFDSNIKGDVSYKIFKLEATANYSYNKEFYHEVLTEKELTSGEEITAKYNVPAKSKLFRWQLVATVNTQMIGFGKFIDTTEDITKEMEESAFKGKAVVNLPRKIIYDITKVRIKHKKTNLYLIPVLVKENWDSVTLKADPNYYFILDYYNKELAQVRIKALSVTTADWCWLYCGTTGNLYLTKHEDKPTQIWILSKRSNLRNGDVVTFRNKYYETAGLYHDEINRKTNVFCMDNKEDEWILEM